MPTPIAADTTTLTLSALIALIVSAIVTGVVKFVFDDLLAERKARRDDVLAERKANRDDLLAERGASRDYTYARRKDLRTLVGSFDGPLMEAAADFHFRLRNLYSGADPTWLARSGYFYRSTVYRFLALFRLAVAFDQRAIYFEPEVCGEKDLRFIRYAKAFQWVMTDVRLFDGTDYDHSRSTAHFYRDHLRSFCHFDIPLDEP